MNYYLREWFAPSMYPSVSRDFVHSNKLMFNMSFRMHLPSSGNWNPIENLFHSVYIIINFSISIFFYLYRYNTSTKSKEYVRVGALWKSPMNCQCCVSISVWCLLLKRICCLASGMFCGMWLIRGLGWKVSLKWCRE